MRREASYYSTLELLELYLHGLSCSQYYWDYTIITLQILLIESNHFTSLKFKSLSHPYKKQHSEVFPRKNTLSGAKFWINYFSVAC